MRMSLQPANEMKAQKASIEKQEDKELKAQDRCLQPLLPRQFTSHPDYYRVENRQETVDTN